MTHDNVKGKRFVASMLMVVLLVGTIANIMPFQPALGIHTGQDGPNFAIDAINFGSGWAATDEANGESDNDCAATNSNNAKIDLKNFNFEIPNGAAITGIQVEIDYARSVDDTPVSVQLLKEGTPVGETRNFGRPSADAIDCEHSDFVSLGDHTDLWKASWIHADIEDNDFGVRIGSGTGLGTRYLDSVRITIFYAESGSITITKDTIPDDATEFTFTGELGSFSLSDGGSKTVDKLVPDTYTITETPNPEYMTRISCTPADNVTIIGISLSINLKPGEDVQCKFTNFKRGSITIIKDTVPNDPQDFEFTTSGGLSPSSFSLDDDGDATLSNTQRYNNVDPGFYTVTEKILSSFSLAIICTDTDGGTTISLATANIDLDPAESITCTYTNTKQGTITIVKDTVPNDLQDFTFTGTVGTFSLDDDANVQNGDDTLSNTKIFTNIAPGSYTVSEDLPVAGFDLTNLVCPDPDGGTTTDPATGKASIDLDEGESITCTYTNTKRSSITITKDTIPDDATEFTFTGDRDLGSFSLSDGKSKTMDNLLPDTYTITEITAAGFDLRDLVCSDPDGGTTTDLSTGKASIDLDPGEIITCTYTNTDLGTIIIKYDTEGVTPLAGAVFEIRPDPIDGDGCAIVADDNGSVGNNPNRCDVRNDEDGDDGLVEINDVMLDVEYTVEQLVAPPGFALDSTPQGPKAIVSGGADLTITFNFDNKLGSIEWEKRLETTTTHPLLGGATFSVSPNPTDGSNNLFSVTDNGGNDADPSPGVIKLIHVFVDKTYTITETSAPSGSAVDSDPDREVTVSSSDLEQVIGTQGQDDDASNQTNTNERDFHNRLGIIEWEKRDTKGILVGGATFTVSPDPSTGSSGSITVTDCTASCTSADKDPDPGQFKLVDVRLGIYTITETSAPSGSAVDSDPDREVTVSSSDLEQVIGTQGQDDDASNQTNTNERDFHNRLGTIVINKADQSGNALAGAAFKITPDPKGEADCGVAGDNNIDLTSVINGCTQLLDENPTSGTININDVMLDVEYTAEEVMAPPGFALDSTPQGPKAIVSGGADLTITFNFGNVKLGSITIIKDTIPDDNTVFTFTGNLGTFSLSDGQSKIANNLVPETYTITETQNPGYMTQISCSPGANITIIGISLSINLKPGENVQCKFTNTKLGTIIISKQTLPNDETDFGFTRSFGTNFFLDDDGTLNNPLSNSVIFPGLEADTYTVQEIVPNPWILVNISCNDGGSTNPSSGNVITQTATINLEPAEVVVCAFINSNDTSAPPPVITEVVQASGNQQTTVDVPSIDGVETVKKLTFTPAEEGQYISFIVQVSDQPFAGMPPDPPSDVDVRFISVSYTGTLDLGNSAVHVTRPSITILIDANSIADNDLVMFILNETTGLYEEIPASCIPAAGLVEMLECSGFPEHYSKFSVGGVKRPTGSGGSDPYARSGKFAFGDTNSPNYDATPPTFGNVLMLPGSGKVAAEIHDNVAVKDANTIVEKMVLPMKQQEGNPVWWIAIVPSDLAGSGTVSFKVVARDYNNNVAEYSGSGSVEGSSSRATSHSGEFAIRPTTIGQQPDRAYSISATGVGMEDVYSYPQITVKNNSDEPLKNIRLMLSPELKGKFLLSDYAIKSISPRSEATVSLIQNGNPNVNVMGRPLPYEGQVIITVDNRGPVVLELSGRIPNESASLQSLFMKMIESKAEQRYKSLEKPDLRISEDAKYRVTLASGESVIKSPSDEIIITNAGEGPLKNIRIMTSLLSDNFLPDVKNVALLPSAGYVKVKLVSKIDNAESPRDLSGELLIVPENGAPVTVPISIEKRLQQDRNTLYDVRTTSGDNAITNMADGIIIRNNSKDTIDSVRLILPRELARVFSLSADSFMQIEPNSQRIVYLQPRGTVDSIVKQILNDYVGEITIVSSDGMKKIIPVSIVWKGISSEHFVIYARDSIEELMKATQVINFLERNYSETTQLVGETKTKTVIYMTKSLDELNMLSNALIPSTYVYSEDVGFVWSNSDEVNTLALREFVYRSITQNYASYWAKQKISIDKGNWLVDGLSNYVTANIVGERGMIKEHLEAFIAEPTSFEWYGAATKSQYGATYTLFKFLAEKYDDGIIDKMLSHLGSTMISNNRCDTFEQCVLLRAVYDANGLNINDKRYDLSIATIVQEWHDYVQNVYAVNEHQ